MSVLHPFVLLPLVGQLLLILTLFQKVPGRWLTYFGLFGIGILLLLICFIGLMSLNSKIILATLPFLVLSVITVIYHQALRAKS